ncbi:MlaD family protein [Labrys monachus]|uniref:Phospholipid/cholesterol/gamma-HCH transport system substrate-binding protein n=1 Tax=Labrys monachus TaxID=217067 RepID=A0ABU0FM76_9HYPH|nr:MlaD family protein [Labrys monachus]MDQ0395160.1 phospholipid/cholesterol/gamma-HCH transport system substrate-binding protein [Labrys monachus]
METRAHNALIGLFTLAVVAAALGFVVWFARISDSQAVKHFEIDFVGSISGLTVGSSVTFNGLRVGQVDTLDLNPQDPSRVIAIISVRDTTPVKVDTSARLEFTGITGGANIQLYGGKPNTADLEPQAGQKYAIIVAQRSELQNLVDGARDTVNQAAQTMNHVDTWLNENESSITATVHNIQTFTKALADNSGNVSDFLQTTGDAAKSISRLADNLNGMSGDLQSLLQAVSPAKVNHIVDNVSTASDQLVSFAKAFDSGKAQAAVDNIEAFSKTLADARQPLSTFATNASSLADRLNTMAPKLDATLDSIRQITAAVDSTKIGDVVDNVTNFTAALGNNADELTGFIKDARKVSGDLAAMTPKVGGAFDNFNKVASAIDSSKINDIVDNFNRFSKTLGDSSAQVKQVVADAGDISRKLNNAADQLDGIMKNITTMTSNPNSQGMFAEITETAKSIRILANNLDARTAVLAKNLTQFSGSGLRDYQQIAIDGQRTLQNIQRTLNSLQRNPQQLIFGPKSSIPDYKGK